MASRAQLIRDLLYFLKTDISSNVTDPISGKRGSSSAFVMTSFPQRNVVYPLITIEVINDEEMRAGMQTTAMDITLTIAVRIWSLSVTQSDQLMQSVLERLRNIQYSTGGSIDNDFHHFRVVSSTRLDEPGEAGIKSRIINIEYKFYNV
jgi:hypothetical protein